MLELYLLICSSHFLIIPITPLNPGVFVFLIKKINYIWFVIHPWPSKQYRDSYLLIWSWILPNCFMILKYKIFPLAKWWWSNDGFTCWKLHYKIFISLPFPDFKSLYMHQSYMVSVFFLKMKLDIYDLFKVIFGK